MKVLGVNFFETQCRMVWLPDGGKIVKICLGLFVLTEYTNVTNRQTDGQTDNA